MSTPLLGCELYVVGVMDAAREGWDLVGVFATKGAAERECCDADHFVKPVALGEPLDPGCWKGVWFPKAEVKP